MAEALEASRHDWPALWKEFLGSNLKQRLWAERKGLNETYVSREFAQFRRQRAERQIEKARLLLASNAALAVRSLASHVNNEDGNIAVRASNSILGAVGLSAQVAAIQINNKVDVAILAQPIFANTDAPLLDAFLGGQNKVIDADPSTDS